jgi:hypothetical protein
MMRSSNVLAAVLVAVALSACGAKKKEPASASAASPVATAAGKGGTATAATPVATAAEVLPIWILKDNGKRCIVAPCPSWSAVNVDSRETVEVAGVDLSALKLAPADESTARQKVLAGQSWAQGTMIVVKKMGPGGDGTVLKVTALLDAAGKVTK